MLQYQNEYINNNVNVLRDIRLQTISRIHFLKFLRYMGNILTKTGFNHVNQLFTSQGTILCFCKYYPLIKYIILYICMVLC